MTIDDTAKNEDGVFEFSLAKAEFPFILVDSETDVKQKMILVEPSGKGRDIYLTGMATRMKGGKQLKTFDGLQASLIAQCCFYLEDSAEMEMDVAVQTAKRKPVALKTIQDWPSKLGGSIFDKCQAMAGLKDDGDDIDDTDDTVGN